MRALLAFICVPLTVFGCASSPKATLTVYLDPPPRPVDDGGAQNDGGFPKDFSCIGVAGFDIVVSSGGDNSSSGPLVKDSPVLGPGDCHLTQPFSIHDIDVDSPASVVVTGYDGDGAARVRATGRVDNLHGGATHLQLETTMTPPSPVLVVYRKPLLTNGAQLADVTSLSVRTVRMPVRLISVTPGAYFSAEPGAYGIPNSLGRDGTDSGLALTVDVITSTMGPLPTARLTAVWNAAGYYQAQ
jgi:hypothetical protein